MTRPGTTPPPPSVDQLRSWGIDPAWSRVVDVPSHDGQSYRWHLLDTGDPADGTVSAATVLCVHGNPTWSYAWKTFLTQLSRHHRVIAVDQLGMGFSERTDMRRYATRVLDLADIIEELGLSTDDSTPLVVAAHDWGGAVAMGWAVDHPDRPAGMILCNTGIAVPEGRSAPSLIRLAASRPLRDLVCRRTSTFVEGTVRLSQGRLEPSDRQAFRAPYRRASTRSAIADFVGDIPLTPDHPSEGALQSVAEQLGSVTCPVLLAWGGTDPVFDDDFAADLARRLPNAELHRFGDANHLVMAEADVAGVAATWLADLFDDDTHADSPAVPAGERRPLWSAVADRRSDDAVGFIDVASGEDLTFAELARRIDGIAAELVGRGLVAGDRVAILTPPGIDLVAAIYGVWRAGGVTVVADRGLGLRGLGRAARSVRPSWAIGPKRALAAARTLRWAPGAERIDVADLIAQAADQRADEIPIPGADDLAAILFTSGATGPAKGVRYLHRQLEQQRDALARTYDIGPDDRLVAAFAPFALPGPALGVPTALPDCDVTKPGELTASALDEACAAVGATMAFGSPAALANVVATAASDTYDALSALRIVFSAGAPVPAETLRAVAEIAPNASLHTPYGMTEVLPVADVSLLEIEQAETAHPMSGVCVGPPVEGAEIRIAPLGFDSLVGLAESVAAGVTGEILVRAPWVSDGYVGLWATERDARPGGGWHRSGDVGHLDDEGRLWVEGRAIHVITTVDGPVASVPVERSVERALHDRDGWTGLSAAVGVGPDGCQQIAIIVESPKEAVGLADPETASSVRAASPHPVAAVLEVPKLPVDIRHNAKIDRSAVARWADAYLAGRRPDRSGWRP